MTGQRNPAAISASAIAGTRSDSRAVRLAEADAIALGVADDARLDDVGREVRERSDDAPRLDRRGDDAAGIDALETQPVELAADALEVPPRDAVLRADDDGVGTEERTAAAAPATVRPCALTPRNTTSAVPIVARSPVTCGRTSKSPSALW